MQMSLFDAGAIFSRAAKQNCTQSVDFAAKKKKIAVCCITFFFFSRERRMRSPARYNTRVMRGELSRV